MATMALIDKVAAQAGQIALLKQDLKAQTKRADQFEKALCEQRRVFDECKRDWEVERGHLLRERDQMQREIARLQDILKDYHIVVVGEEVTLAVPAQGGQ